MDLPDFLYLDVDGEVVFNGHRLRLIELAARYDEGYSPETIALDIYPTLDLPLIYKGIAFYLEHQNQIREMCEENRREIERQAAQSRPGPTLGELRRRMEATRHAKAS